MVRRPLLGVAFCLVVGVVVPSAAEAGIASVSADGRTVTYQAASGETNDLVVDRNGSTVRFDDRGATVGTGLNCSRSGDDAVCPDPSGLARVVVRAGDGNDSVQGGGFENDRASNSPTEIHGDAGNDTLTATNRDSDVVSQLHGDQGDDRLTGGEDADELFGGPGNDRLDGGCSSDDLDGGFGTDLIRGELSQGLCEALNGGSAGVDTVLYTNRTAPVRLNLGNPSFAQGEAGEFDDIDGVEEATTGAGDDEIFGSEGRNTIKSGAGNDSVNGSDGLDDIDGGPGDDHLFGGAETDPGEPGDSERLAGGTGSDTFREEGDAPHEFIGDPIVSEGEGVDTVEFDGVRASGVTVSLDNVANDGARTGTHGSNVHSDIERVIGGPGPDVIVASETKHLSPEVDRNYFEGGDGVDFLDGRFGDDTIDPGAGDGDGAVGGPGTDTITYADRSSPVSVSLDESANDGSDTNGDGTAEEGDNAQGMEIAIGGRSGDILSGNDAGNGLDGRGGDDRLDGKRGADFLVGGPGGHDLVSYAGRSTPVAVRLNVPVTTGFGNSGEDLDGNGSGEEHDVVSDVEDAAGGSGNDLLIGTPGSNRLDGADGADDVRGEAGADVLMGGPGVDSLRGGSGSDDHQGGPGADVADYSERTSRVAVDLDGVADDGETGENDSLTEVEGARGGAGNDSLTGDGGSNRLFGGGGGDSIAGLGGGDTLLGGAQDDTMTGGDDGDLVSGEEGGDVLRGDGGPDAVQGGPDNDSLDGGAASDTIDGAAGTDTATYATRSEPLVVDADGAADDGSAADEGGRGPGERDDVTAATENLFGGTGGDRLTGSDARNIIRGGFGDDTLDGGKGADDLYGDSGRDAVDYSNRSDTRVVVVLDGSLESGGGDDIEYINEERRLDRIDPSVEDAAGTGEGDILIGNDQENDLEGRGGNDVLEGRDESDRLDGGAGKDAVSYGDKQGPVVVDLEDSTEDGADLNPANPGIEERDDVTSTVEDAYGGSGPDRLLGNSSDNTLSSQTGNDRLDGRSGADELNGGDGSDVADYSGRSAPVTVSLDFSRNDGEAGEGDYVRPDTVENIVGGAGADELIGNDAPNALQGRAGDDRLHGAGGDDVLDAKDLAGEADPADGSGDDFLDGGPGGRDLADYGNRTSPVSVTLDTSASDGESGEADLVLENVEGARGGSAADSLTGNGGPNQLYGGPGSDQLHGGEGADELRGGDGNEELDGGAGGDLLAGEGNTDTVDYSSRTTKVTTDEDGQADDGTAGEGDNIATTTERIIGGQASDEIGGGPGRNFLLGGPGGNDTLRGFGDEDWLYADSGADVLDGGDGPIDAAIYGERSTPVNVDLDGIADDGAVGEGDDVRPTTEIVAGGSAADHLTGSSAANVLVGGDGPDVIDGGEGEDRYEAGPGDDDVRSRDSRADEVNCDDGVDGGQADTLDAVNADCEGVGRQTPLPPDTDGDGVVDGADSCPSVAANTADGCPASPPPPPAPPPPPGSPPPSGTPKSYTPPLFGSGSASAAARPGRGGLVTLRRRVKCAGSGPRCRIRTKLVATLRVRGRRRKLTLGSASYAVGAGRSARLKVKLSRRGRLLLAQHRRLRARLSIQAARGDVVRTKAMTLRLRAR